MGRTHPKRVESVVLAWVRPIGFDRFRLFGMGRAIEFDRIWFIEMGRTLDVDLSRSIGMGTTHPAPLALLHLLTSRNPTFGIEPAHKPSRPSGASNDIR